MRNMNCQNIRREIEEAEPGELPSAAVNDHLMTCVNCEKLFRQQRKLQELVGNLGTVAAPGDFDFRLRARLAREKRGGARPFALTSFSFGLRSVAVAMILVLVGATLVFMSLRTRPNNAGSDGVAKNQSEVSPTSPVDPKDSVKDGVTKAVESGGVQSNVAGVKPADQPRTNRNGIRPQLASLRGSDRLATRDLSSTSATVLRPDQGAGAYPSSPFSINASYQSLKVSLDDGRGSSRTISLPTVSFGSQQALSQSASPLMAAARGDW